MVIKNEFEIGQIVYLKTDIEQLSRIITGINVNGNNNILYRLVAGINETYHYGIEISSEKDIVRTF